MFKSLAKPIALVASKPLLVFPALAVALANFVSLSLTGPAIGDLVFGVLAQNAAPETGLLQQPFHFISIYGYNLGILGIQLAFSFVLAFWLTAFYAHFAKNLEGGQESSSAFVYANKSIGKGLAIAVFFASVAAIGFFAYWLVQFVSAQSAFFGGIAVIVLLLAAAYIAIKLSMLLTIIAADDLSLKEGLKKTWEFSGKHLLGIIVLLLAAGAFSALLSNIGAFIATQYFSRNEILSAAAETVFALAATAYYFLVLPVYYIRKEHGGFE
ncbi:MAG: hypothetical protein HY394_02190 [Candidatus Diapherotrites archaeon]|nr:hypothetical protein [Candidatus Diapherotrites archaeon]